MVYIFKSLLKTFRALFRKNSLAVMLQVAAVTALLFAAAVFAGYNALLFAASFLPADSFFADYLGLLGILPLVLAMFLMLPAAMTVVGGIFCDRISRLVTTGETREAGFKEELAFSASSALRLLWLNLKYSPLYLIPALNVAVFWLVNAKALSREYFDMLALKHMSAGEAELFYKERQKIFFIAGILFAIILSLPLINVLAPFFCVIFTTGLIEEIKNDQNHNHPDHDPASRRL